MSAFLRLWIWFSLRQLRMHLWRSAAVLAGVGLGAAVFASVRLATHASVDSFAKSVDTITGRADLTVVRPGGRVPEGFVARLAKLPAVKRPRLSR
jgi:putative ABC transport system permease protein